MGDKSAIEWTDATWNPIVGCSIVSPGCTNCYAMKTAGARTKHTAKYQGLTQPSKAGPVWTGEVRFWEKALTDPLKWREPRRVFVNSMGDLFHEDVPDEWIDKCFAVMALAPQHTFQILTKRPERMREYLTALVRGPWAGRVTVVEDDGSTHPGTDVQMRVHSAMCDALATAPADALNRAAAWQDEHYPHGDGFIRKWPLPNVWLGVSCEDQERADQRIPLLLQTPAAVRFISAEPLLDAIRLMWSWLPDDVECEIEGRVKTSGLDWVIVGGESGPGARVMHPDWARSLREQCTVRRVPFFFKQWGAWEPRAELSSEEAESLELQNRYEFLDDCHFIKTGKKDAGRALDGRTWGQYPEARA